MAVNIEISQRALLQGRNTIGRTLQEHAAFFLIRLFAILALVLLLHFSFTGSAGHLELLLLWFLASPALNRFAFTLLLCALSLLDGFLFVRFLGISAPVGKGRHAELIHTSTDLINTLEDINIESNVKLGVLEVLLRDFNSNLMDLILVLVIESQVGGGTHSLTLPFDASLIATLVVANVELIFRILKCV